MKETHNKLKVVNIYDVEQRHKGHWFDKTNKSFFKSRWSDTAYFSPELNVYLFVSSEKYENRYTGTIEPRKYSIRMVCAKTGNFLSDTIWLKDLGQQKIPEIQFQRYYTSREATNTIKKLDWSQYKPVIEAWRQ